MSWIEALTRWAHVIAGVIWIGHLYFFNFVNAPVQKALDGETKKKLVPELMPRALYFFRWGAMYTWLTGVMLLGLVYYMNPSNTIKPPYIGLLFLSWFVGYFVYDQLWKSPLAKNVQLAAAVSLGLAVGYILALRFGLGLDGSSLFIHLGSLFGTFMFTNVWMRIWPSQRKIVAAVAGGSAPDAALVGLAGLRSRHNTYMSVPLLFTMVAAHHPAVTLMNGNMGWIALTGVIVVGWGIVWLLYAKSASAATSTY